MRLDFDDSTLRELLVYCIGRRIAPALDGLQFSEILCGSAGISFQVRPSSSLPLLFLFVPPLLFEDLTNRYLQEMINKFFS